MARIKSIKKIKYKGTVHDLTVEDIHSYNIDGLSVHNSAVGSLCLYVLGITKLDPIKYDLLFERFINPERISPPDVDIDFDYNRRDEIYDYVYRKYGQDHCCKISTYGTLAAKSVIGRCVKALDLGGDEKATRLLQDKSPDKKVVPTKHSLALSDFISKTMPSKPGTTIESALRTSRDFREQAKKYPELIDYARKLEGTISSAGVHAAGVIVCKNKIVDHVPLRDSKGQIAAQFDGGEVESLGLLKFDFLALKTLTVISKSVELLNERNKTSLDIDLIEPNDPKVFGLLNGAYSNMDNRGIFQFESNGIAELLKTMHVDTFDDMIVTNALYRPGPLGAGVHDLYCDYKHGNKEIKYLHPKMGEILNQTHGIMAYQEDFMKVAQVMAGFTGGQSDTLRKAVGKKKLDLLAKQKDLFVEGCIKNGISGDIATKIFAQIEFFGGYGFNKCLAGDTTVLNKIDGKLYTLEELCDAKDNHIVLDSFLDGKIVEDDLVEVFETGEKDVYEVELECGMVIKCTLDHKFYCADGKPHTVQEIMDNDLEIIYEDD